MTGIRDIAWQVEVDVVVVGSGATGLPAAIVAREAGASVIVVEVEPDIGGHAITSGGNVPLGGGNSAQRAHGIEDSPDLMFRDLTDWSVVEPNGFPDYRYNDHEIVRAFCDHAAATHDFLVEHGVVFIDQAPDARGGNAVGNSVPREMHCAAMGWPMVQTGKPVDPAVRATTSTGNGMMRPLEIAARKLGVEIMLRHRMVALHREAPRSGRVLGIAVETNGARFDIRARKAVIVATGGSTGNVNFRRMFDPRLTEEYCGLAGMPWSDQDASGEIAAMEVGAALWGLYNQAGEFGYSVTKPAAIGCQYNYQNLRWRPGSAVFDKARAIGLPVNDWQDVITVNMLGRRFYDETGRAFTTNNYNSINPYVQGSYLNAKNIVWNPNNWLNAAMAGIGDGKNGGGPIWAIFDADACVREQWVPEPPHVDVAAGFFFRADRIAELARKIVMQYQRVKMPPENLEQTVARYNSFVESGVDADFGKPTPLYKIATPPFYAAWATPVVHDTRAGLRVNAHCQVIDMHGEIIPGLYAASLACLRGCETSFASALHQTVLKALRTRGHEVTDLDLYADGFRPVMSRDERQEYEDPAQYRETVMKYALQLAEAEAIVAVYPTWWYGLPAMLKGYFDRVWAPGIAFDIGADGVFQTDRLDNIRKLGVVTTYGSPWWLIRLYMGDPERKLCGRAIHKLCSKGCTLDWHVHYNMDSSPPERLERFRKRTENAFARW